MSFAQVTLLGNVGRDPEMSYSNDGVAITKFSIATSRKGKGGKEETTWWNITAFRGLGETINNYVHKGDMILVLGTPSLREYTRRDGGTGYSLDVVADHFAFAGGKKGAGTGAAAGAGGDEEDPLGELEDHPF
jgi:single-strand DNA-binding protein